MIYSIWTDNALHNFDINKSSMCNVSPTWASSGTIKLKIFTFNIFSLIIPEEAQVGCQNCDECYQSK